MRIMGVPVRVDSSALLIGGLVAWVYVDAFSGVRGGPEGLALALGVTLAAAGFFASLLAHELGHALMSRKLGIQVRGITLFIMGGFTESEREADRARDDFLVVVMGPVMSLAASAVSYGVVLLDPPAPLDSVAVFLAWANLLLAIFNLIPGYPLDGGRLLRAVLWAASRRPHAATRWAARVGQIFALTVMAYGGYLLVSRGGLSGLWEIVLGGFLLRGASQAHARANLREQFSAQRVRDVMGSAPPVLEPGTTLADALERLQERPSLLWPVGTPLQGALTLEGIDAVADVDWHHTEVRQVMLPAGLVSIAPDATLDQALVRMTAAPRGMLLVVEDGEVQGLLTPSLLGISDA